MCENDFSYCELRAKEVVNASDGKRMGRIVDILFSREDGSVSGIVVPYSKRSVFSKSQDLFIPWPCVQKVGTDVILVQLTTDASGQLVCRAEEPNDHRENKRPPDHGPSSKGNGAPPGCDFRCEKCMLFDCAYRWSQTNC